MCLNFWKISNWSYTVLFSRLFKWDIIAKKVSRNSISTIISNLKTLTQVHIRSANLLKNSLVLRTFVTIVLAMVCALFERENAHKSDTDLITLWYGSSLIDSEFRMQNKYNGYHIDFKWLLKPISRLVGAIIRHIAGVIPAGVHTRVVWYFQSLPLTLLLPILDSAIVLVYWHLNL